MAAKSVKEEKFFKNFLLSETERIRQKLHQIYKNEKFEFLRKFKIFSDDNETSDKNTDSVIGLEDVYKILELILSRDLDFIGSGSKSKVLDLWPKTRATKNNATSELCREKGNLSLKTGQVNDAIEQYNEAVLYAEFNSKPYALALANRAMAWIKVREFSFAVADLHIALACNAYPQENLFKLNQRLAKAYEALEDFTNAELAHKSTVKNLELSQLKPEQKQQLKHEAVQSIRICQKRSTLKSFTTFEQKFDQKFTFSGPKHGTLQNASDALEVHYSDARGRHVIASRDIDVGECLIVEGAATHMAYLKNSLTHCYTCLKHVVSPQPCRTCSAVIFCDEKCREAVRQRHQFDCPLSMYDLYLQHGIQGSQFTSLIFLAYHLATKVPAKTYLEKRKIFEKPDPATLPVGDPELLSGDVVFNMVAHWKSELDLLEKLCTSLFLLNTLQATNYFADIEDTQTGFETLALVGISNSVLNFFSKLLFHFTCGVQCNNHSISEISNVPMGVDRQRVGLGLFPTVASLFNHSCDPNTAPVMEANRQITVASRCIKKGEEICHIYQGHYGDTPLETRRSILQDMYNFTCGCTACTNNYPLAKDLPKTYEEGLLHPEMLGSEVLKEAHTQHLRIGEQILDAIEENNLAHIQHLYSERLRLAAKYLANPHTLILSNRSGLMDTIWLRFGNRNFSAKGQTFKGAYM